MVRLLKVVTEVPPITCAPDPVKFTVFRIGGKGSVVGPITATLIVVPLVPASVAPLSICTLL